MLFKTDAVRLSRCQKQLIFQMRHYFSRHVLLHLSAFTVKNASFKPTPCEKGGHASFYNFCERGYKISHINDTKLIQQTEQVCDTSLIVVTLFTFM